MRTRLNDGRHATRETVYLIVALGLIALAALTSGCATVTERVVQDAIRTPMIEAEYAPVPGEEGAPQLEALFRAAEWLGIEVQVVVEMPPEIAGALHPAGELILLSEALDTNGRVEVLAHEIAHAFQPRGLTRPQAEVWAELVGVEVQQRLGYRLGAKTAGKYLAGYKSGLDIANIYKVDIEMAAKLIVEATRR